MEATNKIKPTKQNSVNVVTNQEGTYFTFQNIQYKDWEDVDDEDGADWDICRALTAISQLRKCQKLGLEFVTDPEVDKYCVPVKEFIRFLQNFIHVVYEDDE